MSYVGKVTADGSTHLVGSTLYGTCTTAAATAAKVVTCADFDHLFTGVTIHVKFDNGNSATNPTANVNSTGAKNIMRYGTSPAQNNQGESWPIGAIVALTYDGTNWVINDSTTHLLLHNMDSKTYLLGTTTSPTVSGVLTGVAKKSLSTIYMEDNGNFAASTFNGYTLAAASAKSVDTSISSGSSSANLPTTAAVVAYVATQMGDVAGALVYKGTVTAESSLLNTALKKGWYYIVAMPNAQTTSITIAGQTCEAGDMVIVNTAGTYTTSSALAAAVDIIQSNTTVITNAEIDTIVAS